MLRRLSRSAMQLLPVLCCAALWCAAARPVVAAAPSDSHAVQPALPAAISVSADRKARAESAARRPADRMRTAPGSVPDAASRQHPSPPAASRPSRRDLHETADSITRWQAAHPDDPLADNLSSRWTDETAGCVRVLLLRADSAARSDFRRRVSDSPLIRLEGFDPATSPYAPAPEGTAPPDGISMHAERAFYPSGTGHIRLIIRYRGDGTLFFGTDHTLSRFRHGRWEVLPVCPAWNAVLIGLGRPVPPTPGPQRPVPPEGETYDFTVWLAPRVFPAGYARYRVSKRVWTEHPHREYLLQAECTVTPFVPFGPYTEPDGTNSSESPCNSFSPAPKP